MAIVARKFGVVLALVGMMVAGPAFNGGAGARAQCYDDWSVSASVVREQGLVSIEELTKRAKSKLGGTIVKTTLCATMTGFAYLVVVRSPKGRLETLEIDALNPFSK